MAAADPAAFRIALASARHVVVLTGAGISAESGIPTFRGAGGLWRGHDPAVLATPQAFRRSPSLVWQFYSWRRDVAGACQPNPAHYALAALEQLMEERGKKITVLSQNVDRLHQAAGSGHVVELHGSIWDVCRAHPRTALKDGPCWEDRRQPLCPALAVRGDPCASPDAPDIPAQQLPRDGEGWLLRPGVVWFGEGLDPSVLTAAHEAVADCQARGGGEPAMHAGMLGAGAVRGSPRSSSQRADPQPADRVPLHLRPSTRQLFITAGTSAVVYPAAGFAEQAAARGVPVAEFNLEPSGSSSLCTWSFRGKAGETLPAALGMEREVAAAVERARAAALSAAQDGGKEGIGGDGRQHMRNSR